MENFVPFVHVFSLLHSITAGTATPLRDVTKKEKLRSKKSKTSILN